MPDFTKHPACGEVIYLDVPQCETFCTDYYDFGAKCCVAASRLLETADYDRAHRRILEPIGSGTVLLERLSGQFPGWFTITKVVPA